MYVYDVYIRNLHHACMYTCYTQYIHNLSLTVLYTYAPVPVSYALTHATLGIIYVLYSIYTTLIQYYIHYTIHIGI